MSTKKRVILFYLRLPLPPLFCKDEIGLLALPFLISQSSEIFVMSLKQERTSFIGDLRIALIKRNFYKKKCKLNSLGILKKLIYLFINIFLLFINFGLIRVKMIWKTL